MIILKQQGRFFQFEKPIDEKLSSYIDKILSYEKKGIHFMKNKMWGIVHMYSKKTQRFPAGLLSKVEPVIQEWCRQKKDTYVINRPEPLHSLPVELSYLRDYQKEAFNKAINNYGGQIVIPVSGGKTKLGERLLCSTEPDYDKIIVVPTQELKKQWEDTCGHVYNCRIETFQKLYRELSQPKKFDNLSKVRLVIFDECHRVAARTIYKVGMSFPNATIYGLTGTQKREDGEDMKVEAVIGPVIYEVPIQKLVSDGHIVPAKVQMFNIEKYKASPIEDYRALYMNGIVKNEERNELIAKTALKEIKRGMCMILFDNLEHGEIIHNTIRRVSPNVKIAYLTGKSDDRELIFKHIKEGKYNLILASRIFNEGINLPELRSLIIASGGQSGTRLVQQVGRVLRTNPGKEMATIYDFNDSCRILSQHTKKRVKIYQENGFEVFYEVNRV